MQKVQSKQDLDVLLVDDESNKREVVKLLLEQFCTENNIEPIIIQAINGKEGLSLMDHFKFDLVISDNQMPIMTGLEMMKRSRKILSRAKSSVVWISGDKQAILNSGLSENHHILELPFDKTSFVSTFQQVLEERKIDG